jgi:ABC-type lipoprotein export system ATPase subunit
MSAPLKRVRAEGLHHRLSFDVSFFDDVNILYGRNGSGKTTLLHILANVMNGSFERFAFLTFDHIEIDLQDEKRISIKRRLRPDNGREVIEFFVDGTLMVDRPVSVFTSTSSAASDDPLERALANGAKYLPDFKELRNAVGANGAAYFPAFRTMIEAWWSAQLSGPVLRSAPWMPLPSPPTSFDEYLRRPVLRTPEERSSLLTDLARQLFGDFVPTLTYPSTTQIEDELRERARSARDRVRANADVTSSSLFVKGLLAFLQADTGTDNSLGVLRKEIQRLLARLDETDIARSSTSQRSDIYSLMGEIVELTHEQGEKEPIRTLLWVFATSLAEQLQYQEREYLPFERYVSSVNAFLEGKKLKIAAFEQSSEPAVVVEFEDGTTDSLRVLSSGELQIVSMLYAASTMEQAAIVLIDEPELSLHLDWQRRLFSAMTAQMSNRQIIACTHSPEIGADFEDRYQEVRPVQLASAAA